MTPEPVPALTRCAVLGSPIAHSLSPVLHRAAYAWLGLSGWSYDAYEVDADGLAAFVAGLDGSWRGLSLTMPLKDAVMALGEPDEAARLVGAGNTLVLGSGRPQVANTDVPGLVDALRRVGVDALTHAVVLGTGATARSVLASVARLGARQVAVLARRPERAAGLLELGARLDVDVTVLDWGAPVPSSDLLLSTVTAGAADSRAQAYAASAPVVFDAVYDPWPTVLATTAEADGATVVNGLDLLVAQAVRQLELMTGRTVPPEVLYTAGRSALAARSHP